MPARRDVLHALERFTLYDRFGWTPRDLSEIEFVEARRMLLILEAVHRIEEAEQAASH